ncbi:MAG: putative Phosphatidylinositol 3-kinase 1 [Streblomastix strix]|uniref:Putative Phosphatidylinositol 3-kinase 1 n=1 Tax=Streblomastix strix TaxID=222440 RepID=A0A5J4X5M2_9EUKA|nr:MAG: putative Phosphatidylinositol 3-kinase 1 [Streblomastix strix]
MDGLMIPRGKRVDPSLMLNAFLAKNHFYSQTNVIKLRELNSEKTEQFLQNLGQLEQAITQIMGKVKILKQPEIDDFRDSIARLRREIKVPFSRLSDKYLSQGKKMKLSFQQSVYEPTCLTIDPQILPLTFPAKIYSYNGDNVKDLTLERNITASELVSKFYSTEQLTEDLVLTAKVRGSGGYYLPFELITSKMSIREALTSKPPKPVELNLVNIEELNEQRELSGGDQCIEILDKHVIKFKDKQQLSEQQIEYESNRLSSLDSDTPFAFDILGIDNLNTEWSENLKDQLDESEKRRPKKGKGSEQDIGLPNYQLIQSSIGGAQGIIPTLGAWGGGQNSGSMALEELNAGIYITAVISFNGQPFRDLDMISPLVPCASHPRFHCGMRSTTLVRDIPSDARLCFTVYLRMAPNEPKLSNIGERINQQNLPGEGRWSNTGGLIFGDVPKGAGVIRKKAKDKDSIQQPDQQGQLMKGTAAAINAVGTQGSEGDIVIGWVSCPVFDYRGVLNSGVQELSLWPDEEAQLIGTCNGNLGNYLAPRLVIRFQRFITPIVFPKNITSAEEEQMLRQEKQKSLENRRKLQMQQSAAIRKQQEELIQSISKAQDAQKSTPLQQLMNLDSQTIERYKLIYNHPYLLKQTPATLKRPISVYEKRTEEPMRLEMARSLYSKEAEDFKSQLAIIEILIQQAKEKALKKEKKKKNHVHNKDKNNEKEKKDKKDKKKDKDKDKQKDRRTSQSSHVNKLDSSQSSIRTTNTITSSEPFVQTSFFSSPAPPSSSSYKTKSNEKEKEKEKVTEISKFKKDNNPIKKKEEEKIKTKSEIDLRKQTDNQSSQQPTPRSIASPGGQVFQSQTAASPSIHDASPLQQKEKKNKKRKDKDKVKVKKQKLGKNVLFPRFSKQTSQLIIPPKRTSKISEQEQDKDLILVDVVNATTPLQSIHPIQEHQELDSILAPIYWSERIDESVMEDGARLPTAEEWRQLMKLIASPPLRKMDMKEVQLVQAYKYALVDIPAALPRYLQSVTWNSPRRVREAHYLVRHWAPLNPTAAMELLDGQYADPVVRSKAVSWIDGMCDEEFEPFILQLVQLLKIELYHDSHLARLLLKRALLNPSLIGHTLFWNLKAEMHNGYITERYGIMIQEYLKGCGAHRKALLHQTHVKESLLRIAKNVCMAPKELGKEVLLKGLKQISLPETFNLPMMPDFEAIGINSGRCRVMDSKKKPLWLNFVGKEERREAQARQQQDYSGLTIRSRDIDKFKSVSSNDNSNNLSKAKSTSNSLTTKSELQTTVESNNSQKDQQIQIPTLDHPLTMQGLDVLFKVGDDIRQDQLTLQVFRIMDLLWKREGYDFRLSIYTAQSTGRDEGFIQIVKNSQTIGNIIKGYGGSLAAWNTKPIVEWLKMHCPPTGEGIGDTGLSYAQAQENFAYSCAGYCVATYVLGIGDRHNDNYMITKYGHFFHIDFGHILGHFKKKFGVERETAPFIFTPAFAAVLDNKTGNMYREFQSLCVKAFLILRKHANLIINLYMMMLQTGIPECKSEKDIEWIQKHLSLEKSDKDAEKEMIEKIEEARTTGRTQFMDFIHLAMHS